MILFLLRSVWNIFSMQEQLQYEETPMCKIAFKRLFPFEVWIDTIRFVSCCQQHLSRIVCHFCEIIVFYLCVFFFRLPKIYSHFEHKYLPLVYFFHSLLFCLSKSFKLFFINKNSSFLPTKLMISFDLFITVESNQINIVRSKRIMFVVFQKKNRLKYFKLYFKSE